MPINIVYTDSLESSPRLTGPEEEARVRSMYRTNGEFPTWGEATDEFVEFVEFLESEHSYKTHIPLTYETFTDKWATAAWKKLFELDKRSLTWAETTLLLPLTGSYLLGKSGGPPVPPITYLSRLQASKDARQKALQRSFSDVANWRAIRTIGGDRRNGYPIVYLGVYSSSRVSGAKLDPVIDSHVQNCQIANHDAHTTPERLLLPRSPDPPSNLLNTLAPKIPGLGSNNGILDESRERRKMATVLHAGKWRPYSFGSRRI